MTAEHQTENMARQIRRLDEKAICLCQSMYKGGNNGVTYVVEVYTE